MKEKNKYKEAVLKALNVGDDTDTTSVVTGGLAGILYGFDAICKLDSTKSKKRGCEGFGE